jgi:hypothetical protein
MNQHDRKNVNFIMSLNDQQFDDWTMKMSMDDIEYAIELIQQARQELLEQEQNLVELELEESNFEQARAALKKFML